jgi:hypothetical protein
MVSSQEKLARVNLQQYEYDLMVQSQGNRCLICRERPTADRALAIDHHHESGVIRGLLCGRCNLGLGYFRDRIDLLQSAARYLQHANERYADMCDRCRKAGDYSFRFPTRVEAHGPGSITAHYGCEICHSEWTCGWTSGPVHLLV